MITLTEPFLGNNLPSMNPLNTISSLMAIGYSVYVIRRIFVNETWGIKKHERY